MVERYLIEHCAPTLASLKAANLFNYPFEDLEGLNRQIEVWNDRLQKSGVRLCLLRQNEHNALIYVYRVKSLQKILNNPETAQLRGRIVNVAGAGRCTAMNVRQSGHLPDTKNAARSTADCGIREGLLCSLR